MYGDENLGEGEAGDPVPLLDGVNADVSVSVDVGMKYLSEEPHLRRPEGIKHRYLEVEVEDASLVWAAHRSSDSCLPVVITVIQRLGLNSFRRVLSETLKVMAQSLVPQRAGLGVAGEEFGHLEDALAAEGTVDEGGELGEPV